MTELLTKVCRCRCHKETVSRQDYETMIRVLGPYYQGPKIDSPVYANHLSTVCKCNGGKFYQK